MRAIVCVMSQPNFSFVSLPNSLLVDISQRVETLQNELPQADPMRLVEPFDRLMEVRGNFALDLISSLAWAAATICHSAMRARRTLNTVEVRSLRHAIASMDRAHRAAVLSAAVQGRSSRQ